MTTVPSATELRDKMIASTRKALTRRGNRVGAVVVARGRVHFQYVTPTGMVRQVTKEVRTS